MRSGHVSVGHPVDVATGTVYSTHEDVSIPGKVDLVWARFYSTALLELPATPLGPGWTTRYFSTLTKLPNEYRFVTPEGYVEVFADPDGTVERGGIIRNFGTYRELAKRDGGYVVTEWNVDTGNIVKYVYGESKKGDDWLLDAIEDVTGQGLDVLRDNELRISGIRQRLEKRTLIIEYTLGGRIQSVSFPLPSGGVQTLARYEYDGDGRLTAAFDAADNAERYEYDSNSRMSRELIKDGGVFYFRYDEKGRCIKTSGLDRYDEKTLRYFEFGWTEVTNSLGHVTRYQWVPTGQVTREINPVGAKRETEYDEQGRIVTKIDAEGGATRYTYDQHGNRITVRDAVGNTYSFTYTDQHLPLSLTDPLGQVWRRAYDSANRLVETIDALGARWHIGYDAEGNVAEMQNPLGAKKRQRYTGGILNAVTDWQGNETHFQLDSFGRVIKRTGPLADDTRFRYDALGNPTEVLLPDSTRLVAAYDRLGNLTSFTDGNGHTTSFSYGPCQRLLERTDPTGGIVRYLWGSEPGQLQQVVNEKGENYSFFRDAVGRIIREQSFDGFERHFKYDAEGYVIAYTNANGETICIKRDALHRVIGQLLPEGELNEYTYDPFGNLLSAVNPNIAVTFERNSLGRITREMQGQYWIESRYDAIANLIGTTTSFGHKVDYDLDDNGFLSKVTTLQNRSQEFKRNAYGQEIARQLPGDVMMEQHYDDFGRLIEQRIGPGRSGSSEASVIPPKHVLIRRSYTYDRNSSLTSVVDSRWGRFDYVYDPAERLLQAMRESGPSQSFSYDPAGNIVRIETLDREPTHETLVYGPGNRLLQKGNTRYEYDAEGRRIKKIEGADSDNPKLSLYEWNALGQLIAVTLQNGGVWRYKYDALGRRIEKTGMKTRRQFVWDKDVVIHETDGLRALSAWIFDAYSFVPLATVQNGRLYSVISDYLGTPKELIDSTGSIVWSISVKAFGEEFRQNRNSYGAVDCPIRFQGQWYDEETALHYNRCRYYDPSTGSFLALDPIGIARKLNSYSYTVNPINWIDPFGLADLKWDNPKSTPTWGHTFSQHGAGNSNTRDLTGRAGGTGQSQGQWTNNNDAAQFLASQRPGLQPGENIKPIPPGLGQVVRPDGTIVPATHAVLVPNEETGGYRTAYPIDPEDERSKGKDGGCEG